MDHHSTVTPHLAINLQATDTWKCHSVPYPNLHSSSRPTTLPRTRCEARAKQVEFVYLVVYDGRRVELNFLD